MATFDPYHKWLGIPPEDQPPNHYRLLGIPELESDSDVIDGAAERQTIYLRTFQTGEQAEMAEQLLNEISAARICLLNAEQKAEYDRQLQVEMQPASVSTPAVRQPSRRKRKNTPIWQQPRMLVAAGGLVAVALLLVVLNTGGDRSEPTAKTTLPTLIPLDADKAKAMQQASANEHGIPIEYTNSIGMKFMLIPAGKYIMGSPVSEEGRRKNEVQHLVTLSKPFFLGSCEVTQKQYERVMGKNPSRYEGGNLPVEMVSWKNAEDFCRRLSELSEEKTAGCMYRLPTEAEWEYACRAGTTTYYNFGDNKSQVEKHGWFLDNSGRKTHPVGEKKPNAWNLHDMHGNVWEWCLDFYSSYPSDAITDPIAPSVIPERVLRGGGYFFKAHRAANRNMELPTYYADNLGFRLALIQSDRLQK